MVFVVRAHAHAQLVPTLMIGYDAKNKTDEMKHPSPPARQIQKSDPHQMINGQGRKIEAKLQAIHIQKQINFFQKSRFCKNSTFISINVFR